MLAALETLKDLASRQKSISTPVLSRLLGTLEGEIEALVPSSFPRAPFKTGKTYLNNAEKMDYYKLVSFNSFLKDWGADVERRGWDKQLVANLKRAFFYTEMAVNQIMNSLDPAFRNRLLSESGRMSIVAMYSRDALDEYKKTLALDSNIPVPREKFYEALLMLDVHLCAACPRWPETFITCPVYDVFVEHEVDVVQDSPPPGICPFSRYEETDCALCGKYHKQCEKTREKRLDGSRCRDFIPRAKK